MPLGNKTQKVSTRDQLLRERNVSGSGNPTHEPEVERQTYVDIDDGSTHEWYAGSWTHA